MASRTEHVALWIGQLVLAVLFLTAGYVKTSTSAEALHLALPWTAALPLALVRVIGVLEGLGGLGVVLPALFRVRPALTPIAATCLTALMLCATVFHLVRTEPGQAGGVLFLGLLALSVAWGRSRHAPIADRAHELDAHDA